MGISMGKSKKNEASIQEKNDSGTANGSKQLDSGKSKGTEGEGWRDILLRVAEMDLWEDRGRRAEREEWKQYLTQAEAAVRKPRKPLPKDIVDKILNGDMNSIDKNKIPSLNCKVIVFVSSTFTDTKAERNLLMRDVYPYMRALCRRLGLDFGAVDMRWGVREEATMEHGTTAMCLREVQRCTRESAGPAFMAILGHKYGYRPLPSEIEQQEFEQILSILESEKEDTSQLREYYRLDTNTVPATHVLKPRTTDQKDWGDVSESMQAQLRQAAGHLDQAQAEKYFISVTEEEVKEGMFNNPAMMSQTICIDRTLGNIRDERHLHRHVIDMKSEDLVDENAQSALDKLKHEKMTQQMSGAADILFKIKYDADNEVACKTYIKEACDKICAHMVNNILKNYEENMHNEDDEVFEEAVQHRLFVQDKCSLFVGREDLVAAIMSYVSRDKEAGNQVYTLYGRSGCGKTALMAVAAEQVKERFPESVVVVRFLGTTARSGSARAVLNSICLQITRVYGKNPSDVPSNYKDLITYFKTCLSYATSQRPLTIFLDSLDQLSNEDFGKTLKWLSLKETLPSHVHIVVSTLPIGTLNILQACLPSENFLEVSNLKVSDGPLILDKMLAAFNRTLTEQQRLTILDAFSKCPLPLYMRLAVDVATRWHSYDEVTSDSIAPDMPGLIDTLFDRLESRYGQIFVRHALAYITAAKDGLSVAELEDILSCDDEVLDEIFQYWTPPLRRIPQLLWIRIRNELGMYLVERGTDGVNAYNWYHRQFWETAEKRYLDNCGLSENFRFNAHEAIADYFDAKWLNGKPYVQKTKNKSKSGETKIGNRQLPSQPIVISGDRGSKRKLNRRKLSELPYQLLKMQAWGRIEESVASLQFIEAKFECGKGFDCQSEFFQAAKSSSSAMLKSVSRFVGAGLSHLLREPEAIYQLALQQVPTNPMRKMIDAISHHDLPHSLLKIQNEVLMEDPCEMTLRGHTSGIRCCQYSPGGDLIVSTAEDASLRIWDAYSGAEVVTVTGLPGPTYPGLADPYHGERPCTFSRDGELVVTGSENGIVQVFDINGGEKYRLEKHSNGVTGTSFSPDNSKLATCSKDGLVVIWSTPDFSVITQIPVPGGQLMCCQFSPDGTRLAVSMYGSGLALIDTSSWHILSNNASNCSINICIAYAPNGQKILTGGDDSAITVWDAANGCKADRWTGHKGWVWGVTYTADGMHVISCSSDRSIKVWNAHQGTVVVSLGGHLHRVCWASIPPSGNTFVTGSLDFSLKVWDMKAVLSGAVPPTGNMHYNIFRVSLCGKYLATSQGWTQQCWLEDVVTETNLCGTAKHSGFLAQVAFTKDSAKLVSVDTGHTGAYEAGASLNAHAKVTSLPGGEVLCEGLGIVGPACVDTTHHHIVIGSYKGEVKVFDKETYEEVASGTPTDQYITDLVTSTAGPNHIAIAYGKTIKVFQLGSSTLSEIKEMTMDDTIKMLAYSKERHLAAAIFTGQVIIADGDNGYSTLKVIQAHVGNVKDMVYSPDGVYLGTAGVDMSMRVWDIKCNYTLLAVFYGASNMIGFLSATVIGIGEASGTRKVVKILKNTNKDDLNSKEELPKWKKTDHHPVMKRGRAPKLRDNPAAQ